MDWRRTMRGAGRTLISAGVLILLFVAYQLWGTGIAEARSQRALKGDFTDLLREVAPPAPSPDGTTPTTAPVGPPPPPSGEAVAIMRIPAIGVEKAVVQGVGTGDLKKGPGHYPETPMPGQPGNAAIAGHRTTYGAPFFELDKLQPGDPIFVTTRQGSFRYEVRSSQIVRPSEVSVLAPTEDNRLTLTTCHPRYSARQRLVVVAALIGEAAPPSPVAAPGPTAGEEQTPEQQERAQLEGGDEAGLSGDRSPAAPAVVWGALVALVWLATWVLSRRWRKWPAYAVGTPVFLVVLFVFFENFSRLLPANF